MNERPVTLREQLLALAHDEGVGVRFGSASWSWRRHIAGADRRARALASMLSPDRPPHVGLLMDNTPEMVSQLAAAGLGGHVVVGLNTTRRGSALAADIAASDCQVIVTEPGPAALLDGLSLDIPVIDASTHNWEAGPSWWAASIDPDTLFMLIFTSGTSGDPKAVRVTHEKVTVPGVLLSGRFGLTHDDCCYLSMPLFHSNAVMAGWALAVASGATMGLAKKFSATHFLDDVREYGATYANYVGKPLSYVLATPARAQDAENPLRLVFGNEANERDIAAFASRFACEVVDSYSSTENAVIVQRLPGMPPGSLGRGLPGVEVLSSDTGERVPDAVFDSTGALLNGDEAVGELVNTSGAGAFAGYYNNEAADLERMRGGMYWSGDLAYRDASGWLYFAGRTADWLRVDGENLAAAPIERILMRHASIAQAAVYAVPDDSVGDQVMAALWLAPEAASSSQDAPRAGLTPEEFETFLAAQDDLSGKAWPRFVRLLDELPQTATHKILKRELARGGASAATWVRAERGTSYSPT